MALRDSACYTLTLGHSPSDPGITTFSSYETGREEVQFARVKEQHAGEAYSAAIHGGWDELADPPCYLPLSG